jgi:hypothetical protein
MTNRELPRDSAVLHGREIFNLDVTSRTMGTPFVRRSPSSPLIHSPWCLR